MTAACFSEIPQTIAKNNSSPTAQGWFTQAANTMSHATSYVRNAFGATWSAIANRNNVVLSLSKASYRALYYQRNSKIYLQTATLQVVGSDGKPRSHLSVELFPSGQTIKTDAHGMLQFSNVPIGNLIFEFHLDKNVIIRKELSLSKPCGLSGETKSRTNAVIPVILVTLP